MLVNCNSLVNYINSIAGCNFCGYCRYHLLSLRYYYFRSVIIMEKKHELSLWTIIGMIAAVAAVVASITTAMIIIKKKEKEKEDRELQEYLDYSIQ